jgi:hypothetical protein
MLKVIAKFDKGTSESLDKMDLYTAEFDDESMSIDFYVPKGSLMTTADMHVEFERDTESNHGT